MNAIQEAIARVTGVDELIGELQDTLEHVGAENALLQRQIEDIDYLNLFDLNHITDVIPLGDRKKAINRLRRLRHENPLAKQSVNLLVRFTLGKGIQLVVGPDPSREPQAGNDVAGPAGSTDADQLPTAARPSNVVDISSRRRPVQEQEETDQTKDILNEFWWDRENQIALTSHEAMREWVDAVRTDGEKYFVCVEGAATPYIRMTEIPIEEIQTIIYHPNNWKIPVYYKRQHQELIYDGANDQYKIDGEPKTTYYLDYRITDEQLADVQSKIKIPASKIAGKEERIFHTMVNPIWTKSGKRGLSELYASREWFRVYKEFMEDRAAINSAATSVAFKRKIKADATGVARFKGKFGDLSVGYDSPDNTTEIRKLTRPVSGAIYDSNPAVDLEWMKTDTGAANAEKDGRGLLAAAGAGVGMFVHYYGEGGDANLATAQAMELPMVKTFEDSQQWVDFHLLQLLEYVLRVATDDENARKQITRVGVSFPPIISQDVVKYTTAWGQVVSTVAPGNRIVSREAIKAALVVMQVPNVDALMVEIEAEELRLEAERQAQKEAMLNAFQKGGFGEEDDEDGKPGAPRDGSSNPGDSRIAAIAKGKDVAPSRGRIPASR